MHTHARTHKQGRREGMKPSKRVKYLRGPGVVVVVVVRGGGGDGVGGCVLFFVKKVKRESERELQENHKPQKLSSDSAHFGPFKGNAL